MAASTNVILPRSQSPIFADVCVACGRESPDGVARLKSGMIGWWLLFGPWLWFSVRRNRVVLEVPACQPCERRIRRQRIRFHVIAGVYFACAMVAAPYLIAWYDGPFADVFSYWVALPFLIPAIAWSICNPLPFDITVTKRNVTYEFSDADCGRFFANQNDAVIE